MEKAFIFLLTGCEDKVNFEIQVPGTIPTAHLAVCDMLANFPQRELTNGLYRDWKAQHSFVSYLMYELKSNREIETERHPRGVKKISKCLMSMPP